MEAQLVENIGSGGRHDATIAINLQKASRSKKYSKNRVIQHHITPKSLKSAPKISTFVASRKVVFNKN